MPNTFAKSLTDKLPFYSIVAMECFLLVSVFIPFFVYNSLQMHDMAGHYFSAWYIKTHLFPLPTGWNPYFYAGFPQGQFYPPLFHYLVATLSFILGVDLSFKLLLCFAIALIPVSANYFAKQFEFPSFQRVIILGWIWLLLWYSPIKWGGNLSSTFNLGEVTNLFALPFLFFYWGMVPKSFARRKWCLSSFLLGMTILAHIYTGIVAFLGFTGLALPYRKDSGFYAQVLKHFLLVFLLLSFWGIPFVATIKYIGGAAATPTGFTLTFLVLFLFVLYLILERSAHHESRHIQSVLSMCLFLITVYHFRFVPDLPIHFERFSIYLAYLAIFPILIYFKRRGFEIPLRDSVFVTVATVCATAFLIVPYGKHADASSPIFLQKPCVSGVPKVNIAFPKQQGRVLCISDPDSNLRYQKRTLSHLVPRNTGNVACVGLFAESSLNAPYVQSIPKLFDARSPLWGIKPVPAAAKNISYYLRYFNINSVLSTRPLEMSGFQKSDDPVDAENMFPPDQKNPPTWHVYHGPQSELVELLKYAPKTVSKNWEIATAKWWISDEIDQVVVYTDGPLPHFTAKEGDSVDVLEISHKWDYLKIKVQSDDTVPILVKASDFPNWKAFVNGKPTRIYRASPSLMLLYGQGIVELRYGVRWYNLVGWGLSIVGVLWYFFYWIHLWRNSNKERKEQ